MYGMYGIYGNRDKFDIPNGYKSNNVLTKEEQEEAVKELTRALTIEEMINKYGCRVLTNCDI